jgi:hypothetical protein
MVEIAAVLPDLGNIVGAVHQIIQVGDPLGQGNRVKEVRDKAPKC